MRGWPSIGYNAHIAGWYWTGGGLPGNSDETLMVPNRSMIKKPAQFVLLADSPNGDTNAPYNCRGYLTDNNWYGGCSGDSTGRQHRTDITSYVGIGIMARHSGGLNLGFADGHTKWFRLEQVLPYTPQQYQAIYGNRPCRTVDEYRDFNPGKTHWVIFNTCNPDYEATMQTFREKPILAWGLLVVALIALFLSYYLFLLRPAQPAVPSAPSPTAQPAPQSPTSSGGQTVPY
jgi:prepilin-type processing-associated H-X9-DG protein